MEERDKDVKADRKPYVKPEATRFQLRPEEAVLGNCKTSGSSGSRGQLGCRSGLGSACSSIGS